MSARRIAIYSPGSAAYFEDDASRAEPAGGGAEVQMAFLARALAGAGLETALIVWPLRNPAAPPPRLTLIERPGHAGEGGAGGLAEARHIWSSLKRADADACLFRGGSPRLVVGAAFSRLHRRKLVFSAANDLDFDFERPDRSARSLRLYRGALARADLVVVQRAEQRELARAAGVGPLELIPSFAEVAEPATEAPEAFIWIGRLVGYKRPLAYLRLAEALPELRFRMVFWATDETEPELLERVERAGRELDNLELSGKLPRERVTELIARAPAVVSTSEAEGMPNVFLEAWARAVPVLSLDYDPDGLIESRGLGLMAGGDEAELARAAASLWADPALRARLGSAGREHVVAEHSPEAVGARWAEAIGALTGAG